MNLHQAYLSLRTRISIPTNATGREAITTTRGRMEAEAGTLTQAPLLKWNAHHMVHRTNPGSKGHVYGAEVSKYDNPLNPPIFLHASLCMLSAIS